MEHRRGPCRYQISWTDFCNFSSEILLYAALRNDRIILIKTAIKRSMIFCWDTVLDVVAPIPTALYKLDQLLDATLNLILSATVDEEMNAVQVLVLDLILNVTLHSTQDLKYSSLRTNWISFWLRLWIVSGFDSECDSGFDSECDSGSDLEAFHVIQNAPRTLS